MESRSKYFRSTKSMLRSSPGSALVSYLKKNGSTNLYSYSGRAGIFWISAAETENPLLSILLAAALRSRAWTVQRR